MGGTALVGSVDLMVVLIVTMVLDMEIRDDLGYEKYHHICTDVTLFT